MGWENRRVAILAAFIGACGSRSEPQKVEQPTLEVVQPADQRRGPGLGGDVVQGFLRPCKTLSASRGLVELSCGEHQIVEFRKAESAGQAERDLDDLMSIMRARFGALTGERSDSHIDAHPVRVERFRGAKGAGTNGMAVIVSNVEGHYWGFACYRKDGEASDDFCAQAVATAARAGGLAHVQASALKTLGDGELAVPEGCESSGQQISCSTGRLSWSSGDGRDAGLLQEQTVAKVEAMAEAEEVLLQRESRSCQLLGAAARCLLLQIDSADSPDSLSFVLVTGGGQERFVVCTFPRPIGPALPQPCSSAIQFEGAAPAPR